MRWKKNYFFIFFSPLRKNVNAVPKKLFENFLQKFCWPFSGEWRQKILSPRLRNFFRPSPENYFSTSWVFFSALSCWKFFASCLKKFFLTWKKIFLCTTVAVLKKFSEACPEKTAFSKNKFFFLLCYEKKNRDTLFTGGLQSLCHVRGPQSLVGTLNINLDSWNGEFANLASSS